MFFSTRAAAGLVLGLLLAASPFASAQTAPSVPELPEGLGAYDVVVGPDGTFVCTPADAEPGDTARRASAPVHLTVLESLNAPEQLGGLRIILRATDQLLERPDALLAFRRAAARWERAITTPITVVYDIDYGPRRFGAGAFAPTTIASANSASGFVFNGEVPASVQDVVAQMRARAADDPQLQALYDAIPDPLPSTAVLEDGTELPVSFVYGGQPTLQMLGYLPAQINPDPAVTPFGDVPNLGFNSAFDFDFDPNDGNDPNLTDFESIVIHEMGHSLGFTSAIGFALQQPTGGAPYVLATPWDLFRVRPDAVEQNESFTDGVGWEVAERVVTPGPVETETFMEGDQTYFKAVQVFYDGLHEYETSTATGARADGDGQQASHWRDDARRAPTPQDDGDRYIGIMDPNFGRGVRQLYKYPDLRVLETLGYGINFSPSYAGSFALAIGGDAVPVDGLLAAPVQLGDVATSQTNTVDVTVSNPSSLTDLAFDVEVIRDAVYPEGASLTASFATAEGVVAGGGNATVGLQIGGSDAPAFFAGRLRFRTNFDSLLVVEIPVEFSVGGATEPALLVAGVPEGNSFGDFGDLGDDDTAQVSFTVSNEGSLPLQYEVITQLAARTFDFDTAPDAGDTARQRAGSTLEAFLGAAARQAAVLYATDFEDADAFDALAKGGDWQLVDGGAAALGGHSATQAAYFGGITPGPDGDVYQYLDNASGRLLLPALDLSGARPQDLAAVTFRYYLQAEKGFDFASVLYSIDGGQTFETATTSDQGLLTNTDTGWVQVMVDVSAVAGLPDPVLFAFEFVADGGVTDEGWYIDDVEVAVLPDANPFYAVPRSGRLADQTDSDEVTATAVGSLLAPGFYTGVVSVVTNQRADDPAPFRLTFTAGDPQVPTLVPSTAAISVTIPAFASQDVELDVTNSGAAPLTYVRVLEPALSAYRDLPPAARVVPERSALAEITEADLDAAPVAAGKGDPTGAGASAPGQASAELATTFATALTQLPDGRVLVSDVGSPTAVPVTFVIAEDLSSVESLPGATPLGNQILALAYNDRTESLWYAGFQSGLIYEVTLDGSTLTATGRTIDLGFQVSSLTYSKALDLFLAAPYQSNLVYAFDASGSLVPGYPFPFFRGSSYSGLSVAGGVVEIGYLDLFNSPDDDAQISYIQYDQFGRLYAGNDGSPIVRFDDPEITASRSARAFARSRTNPDGAFYVLTRGADGLNARVVSIDPPDLDPATQTFVQALEPSFGNDLAPQGMASLQFRLSPDATPGTVARDTVAFLTNSPTDRVVRIPVEVSVSGFISSEDDAPLAFTFHGARPNPLRGVGQVEFDLPVAATVTVSVYNALGQRVAVLAAASQMAPGSHALPFPTGELAAGVYIVRVDAGTYGGTQKVTVIR